MNVKLDRVKSSEKDVLFRLLQYSLFEESLNDFNEMNQDGFFEYKYFDSYFNNSNRDALFIKECESDKLLGFVMINDYIQKNGTGHSIAEFMIIPKYRRNKIGKKVAFDCFNLYKGYWEISPSFGSDIAYKFWKNVIDEYTNCNNSFIDGIFIFNSLGVC